MAVSDETSRSVHETEKSVKEVHRPREKKERPMTKVIVRRLPPGMDQESFIMQVSPLPEYDYLYIVRGDMSLGENAFARAYINFVNATDVFLFKDKFDNYVFVDQKGHEYSAVVEFASFQKIPRKRKARSDPKCGTIESDLYYMEFLESLKEQPNQEEKPEYSYQFEGKEEVTTTPLLDYIKQRRIDKQRLREERREERRRKELERKKLREEEKKRHDHKSPTKTKSASSNYKNKTLDSVKEDTEKTDSNTKSDGDEKEETQAEKTASHSYKEKKYDEKRPFSKPKPKYMSYYEKPDYHDRKIEYKRRDDYREKEYRNRRFDDYKKEVDVKDTPRKAKKYSEKREERRNEAKKAEQKKIESTEKPEEKDEKKESPLKEPKDDVATSQKENSIDEENKLDENIQESVHDSSSKVEDEISQKSNEDDDISSPNKEAKTKPKDDPRVQRRIRNKDRPAMQIYQPGMLSKRRTVENGDAGSINKE